MDLVSSLIPRGWHTSAFATHAISGGRGSGVRSHGSQDASLINQAYGASLLSGFFD